MVIKMIHTRVSLLSHFVAIFNPPFSWQHGIIQVLRSAYPQVFQLANLFWELLQAILVKVQHLQHNVKPMMSFKRTLLIILSGHKLYCSTHSIIYSSLQARSETNKQRPKRIQIYFQFFPRKIGKSDGK